MLGLGTQKVTAYHFNAKGYNICLVDTPGFNDTYKSDTELYKILGKEPWKGMRQDGEEAGPNPRWPRANSIGAVGGDSRVGNRERTEIRQSAAALQKAITPTRNPGGIEVI